MEDSYLDQRFNRAAEALQNAPMMGARFSPHQLYMLATALDNWLLVPDPLPQQQLVMEYFYACANRIYSYLEQQDPRLTNLSDLGNKWCFMGESEGGKAIIEAFCTPSGQAELNRGERDYTREVLSSAISHFIDDTCIDDMGMENAWETFQDHLEQSIRKCIGEPLPYPLDMNPKVQECFAAAEHEVVTDLATRRTA